MAKWDMSKLGDTSVPQTPKIQAVEFFATPADTNDLIAWIEKHNGGEKTAAMVGAMMAWNLACSIVNGSCTDCEPIQTLNIPE